jgi:multisubunit Na+/H+ antiporter MnhB subunit
MIERVRERKERHKQRPRIYRVVFAIGGVLVILLGLLLSLPGVPGPGILLLVVGLGMLALEFDRAERLLERIVNRLDQVNDAAKPWQKVVVGVAAVVGIAFAVAAIALWDVPVLPG